MSGVTNILAAFTPTEEAETPSAGGGGAGVGSQASEAQVRHLIQTPPHLPLVTDFFFFVQTLNFMHCPLFYSVILSEQV